MWNESRLKPYEASPIPNEASSARALMPGTVARGDLQPNSPLASGLQNGRPVTQIPLQVTEAVVKRGQERFNIYCAPCHGRLGDGQGLVVKRGFPPPPDYNIQRLRDAPVGHFFDVQTNGYGIMYSYANRVPVPDRWAIAAYIRVLQKARPGVPVDVNLPIRVRARQRSGVPTPRQEQSGEEGQVPPGGSGTQPGQPGGSGVPGGGGATQPGGGGATTPGGAGTTETAPPPGPGAGG